MTLLQPKNKAAIAVKINTKEMTRFAISQNSSSFSSGDLAPLTTITVYIPSGCLSSHVLARKPPPTFLRDGFFSASVCGDPKKPAVGFRPYPFPFSTFDRGTRLTIVSSALRRSGTRPMDTLRVPAGSNHIHTYQKE